MIRKDGHRPGWILVAVMIALMPFSAQAQTYIEIFGQNRIQYRKFQWKYFDTKHFRVYEYDRTGLQLGRYVCEEAENTISVIEKKLGGQFPKRFNIILYNSYDDYRQSNIGQKDENPITGNTRAGTLNIVGDKLVVYFNGEHNDLRHQIRTGMARVVMERMIFGESFKKIVKNALLLNLPEWVTDGYIAYLVDGWDAQSNSKWKSLLDARPNAGFYELSEQYPELAGKAFWRFVSEEYGFGTVKNLLYSMQQRTSVNKAMQEKENLDMKVTKAYDSCIHFYKNVYAKDELKQEKPDSTSGLIALKVPKDDMVLRNIHVSPRGSDVAYVAWKDGKYTVYTQKTSKEQERSVLLEGGMKDLTEQIDPNYPMMAWSATGNKLAILYRKGFKLMLKVYNSERGRIDEFDLSRAKFDRILGVSFAQDDDKMVFSAIKKSQTDLYMYTIKTGKAVNITNDPWDDLSPVFVSGGSMTGILFLSNRTMPNMNVPLAVNQLPTGLMNAFFYNTRTERPELLQLTNVKSGNVTQPVQYGLDNFAYLYDSNGINNKYVVLFARDRQNKDSAYSVPITNYNTSIISHQYNQASGDVADIVQEKDQYKVYFHEMQMPGQNVQPKKLYPTTLSVEKPVSTTRISVTNTDVVVHPSENSEEPSRPEIKGGNAFQSEFSDTTTYVPRRKARKQENNIFNANKENAKSDSSLLTEITDSAYLKMKPSPYKVSFKPDFFTIKLDNSLLFSQYQSIATNGGQYQNPDLGALATLSLNDVMEDYRITAGLQIPINTSAATYFLQYQNFRKRLDWGLLFLRNQDKESLPVGYADQSGNIVFVQNQLFKTVTNLLQADFSYPLDRVRSIRFHTAMRQDNLVEKATDTLSLGYPIPNTSTYTSLSRLEYVFDNTITPTLNILNGTRFKVYGEYLYGLNKGNRNCYNLGLDIRNYQKLYKNIILANRLAYAHSDGNSEVEYLLGGVDNWISPKQSPNASQPPADNLGFQAMETSLRGYKQYARTGNNFALLNTEVRVPVLTTFMKRPIQSAILKNLQFVAFMDAGSAWMGFLPDANATSTTFSYPSYNMPATGGLNNVFLQLTVPNSAGLALGYGAGLRTSLFGYFVRCDAAWNIDGIKKPIIYVALGTDF